MDRPPSPDASTTKSSALLAADAPLDPVEIVADELNVDVAPTVNVSPDASPMVTLPVIVTSDASPETFKNRESASALE